MLIKQVCEKNVIFVIIGIFEMFVLNMRIIMMSWFIMISWCRENYRLSWFNAKAISFNNVAIVYVKGNAYRIRFWYVSKDDAINILAGSNLVDKRDVS